MHRRRIRADDEQWARDGILSGYLPDDRRDLEWLVRGRADMRAALWELRDRPVPRDYVVRLLDDVEPARHGRNDVEIGVLLDRAGVHVSRFVRNGELYSHLANQFLTVLNGEHEWEDYLMLP